jgi:hypothetical protein
VAVWGEVETEDGWWWLAHDRMGASARSVHVSWRRPGCLIDSAKNESDLVVECGPVTLAPEQANTA